MSTTLGRIIELYINGDLPGGYNSLLKSKTSSDSQDVRIRVIAGNRFVLRLYFRKPATTIGAASSVYELASPHRILLVGKMDQEVIDGDVLFRVADWLIVGSGDGIYYQGVIDLNTAPITTLFSSGPDEIPVSVDIQVRDEFNSERITWRAELTLCRRVDDGVGIIPSDLAASYLQSPDESTWQISINDDGHLVTTKIASMERDPDFITLQNAVFITPLGYYYELSIDDNGQPNILRVS